MPTPPLISIIIPVYNCQDDISFAIDSVLQQNFVDDELEIILINDGSTDDTPSIIDAYKKQHRCIRVFHQSNIGIGKTRNLGIQYAEGTYIYFLDADDFIAPNSLKPILERMVKEDLDIAGFGSKTTTVKQIPNELAIKDTLEKVHPMTGIRFIEKNDFMHTVWWYICNREFVVQTGLKIAEGNVFEDSVFTSNLLCLTQKMIFLPVPIHQYYIRASSIMNNTESAHYRNVVQMYVNTSVSYTDLIHTIQQEDTVTETVVSKLKTRQQWLAFFGISRAMKSKMKVTEVRPLLRQMTEAQAYPLDDFIGEYNKGLKLKAFTFLFNRKYLLYPVMYLYQKIPAR